MSPYYVHDSLIVYKRDHFFDSWIYLAKWTERWCIDHNLHFVWGQNQQQARLFGPIFLMAVLRAVACVETLSKDPNVTIDKRNNDAYDHLSREYKKPIVLRSHLFPSNSITWNYSGCFLFPFEHQGCGMFSGQKSW